MLPMSVATMACFGMAFLEFAQASGAECMYLESFATSSEERVALVGPLGKLLLPGGLLELYSRSCALAGWRRQASSRPLRRSTQRGRHGARITIDADR